MASSDLTMALLAGGRMDPAYLPYLRKMGIAQGMIGAGTDASPAYPMQALARVLQAGVGGYLLNSGDTDLKDVLAGRAASDASTLGYLRGDTPSLSPLGAALTGPPPPAATPPPQSGVMPGVQGAMPQPAQQPQAATGTGGGTNYAARFGNPNDPNWATENLTTVESPGGAKFQVNKQAADSFRGFLGDLEAAGYKVNPGESGGYNLRNITGGSTLSPHAYGVAIDINPAANPYSKTPGGGTLQTDLPPNVGDLAEKWGLQWGGNWQSLKDPMHFEFGGSPGRTQYAQANNVATDAGTAPPQIAQGGAQPAGAPQAAASIPGAPQPAGMPATGMNAPNVRLGLDMMRRAQEVIADPHNQYRPEVLRAAEMQLQQAQTIMGLDTFATLPNGVQVNQRTGELKYAPIGRMATDSAGNVISLDANGPHIVSPANPQGAGALAGAKAGAEVVAKGQFVPTSQNGIPGQMNLVTGEFKPTITSSPRFVQTPSGAVLAGTAAGVNTVVPADNPGVAARAAAGAQGAKVGEQAATTVDHMVNLGTEADRAIGNIDYGMNQLHQAAAGGINSGYFAPWLATAAAAGKSLGVDLHALGIDPTAVGSVQSAQKTLGVVAGTILQNTIGKDSQITDAKIEHFIHTQPGIETDPQAIARIMDWARSQFVFSHNMALDAMHNVDPNTGMLPAGWRAQFHAKNGFAPIYDPLSGEMKQPRPGEGPSQEPPAPVAPQATAPTPPAQSAPSEPPPVPGARQAPDGKWYLADPKRPGKYLQVQ